MFFFFFCCPPLCGINFLYSCNGQALDRVTKPKHRPNGQIMSKKSPKIVSAVPLDNFWTFFGHFFDIFRTFCRHSLFLSCPTICPLQLYSVDVSDIFFFLLGGGEGGVRGAGGGRGRGFFAENPRRGGGSFQVRGGGGARGWRVFAGNLGGGGQTFLFGAEIPTKFSFL